MHRDDFLERANQRAMARYGVSLTPRQLRDLVDERIVPGPTRQSQAGQRSPTWGWGRDSYRRLLQVCRLKSQGAKSFAAIRTVLWIQGSSGFTETVRSDLLHEFKPMRNQLNRPIGTDAGPVTDKDASDARTARLARRLDQPSPLLRPADFEFSSKHLPAVYDAMRFDTENAGIATLLLQFVESLGLPEVLATQVRQTTDLAADGFTGIAGDPEEISNSAERTISDTNAQSFMLARQITVLQPALIRFGARVFSVLSGGRSDAWKQSFDTAASALTQPLWKVAECVRWLHWAHNATAVERTKMKDLMSAVPFILAATGEHLAKRIPPPAAPEISTPTTPPKDTTPDDR